MAMGTLKNIAAAAGLLAAAGIGETVYFYNRTMKRGNAKTERTTKMSGTDWEKYFPLMEERKKFVMAQPHRDVYITSYDGLKLHATYFPAIKTVEAGSAVKAAKTEETDGVMRSENAAGTEEADAKIVICFHGYTGEGLSNHVAIADYFLKHGYAMLLPDARAHGGGFSSPKEVFTHVLNHMYHLPAFPAIQGADLLNRKLAGYGMDECNARREVQKAKVPILFIHGSEDTFVPCSMCHEIYDNCRSPKRKLIVEGASHAESYYKDMEAYEKALTEFAEEIMA